MTGSPRKKWRRLYLLARNRGSLGTNTNETSSTCWAATWTTVRSQYQMWIMLAIFWPYFRRGAWKNHPKQSRACGYGLCCYSQIFFDIAQVYDSRNRCNVCEKHTFLITMYCGINFVTAKHILSRMAKQLLKELKIIMDFYSRGSTIVQNILMYLELNSTKAELMGKTFVKTSSAREIVADIERWISTVNKRCRDMASDLSFNCLQKFIVVNLVCFWILWLNPFPVKNVVSQEFSQISIVVGTKSSWKQHCRIKFGDYANIHDEPDPSNTLDTRSHPEISVSTTANFNGNVKFFLFGNIDPSIIYGYSQ